VSCALLTRFQFSRAFGCLELRCRPPRYPLLSLLPRARDATSPHRRCSGRRPPRASNGVGLNNRPIAKSASLPPRSPSFSAYTHARPAAAATRPRRRCICRRRRPIRSSNDRQIRLVLPRVLARRRVAAARRAGSCTSWRPRRRRFRFREMRGDDGAGRAQRPTGSACTTGRSPNPPHLDSQACWNARTGEAYRSGRDSPRARGEPVRDAAAPDATCYRGTDNFGAGVNSRQSTMPDFSAAAVVTTHL
jgi:hypothetical protein